VLLLTNGYQNIQISGSVDLKTSAWTQTAQQNIPPNTTYPQISEITIPQALYTSALR
jgi:hypothetical protein